MTLSKTVALVFSVIGLVSSSAGLCDEINSSYSVKTYIFKYFHFESSLSSGTSLKQVSTGLSPGLFKVTGSYYAGIDEDTSAEKAYSILRTNAASQKSSLDSELDRLSALKLEMPKVDADRAPETPSARAETTSESASSLEKVGAIDLEGFKKCAAETRGYLKKLRAATLVGSPTAETFAVMINRDRANGEMVSPDGIVCGRYLGSAGFGVSEEVKSGWFESKMLLAVSAIQEQADFRDFVRGLVAAQHARISSEGRAVWNTVLNRAMAMIVFGRKEKVDYRSIFDEMIRDPQVVLAPTAVNPVRYQVTFDRESALKEFESALKIASELVP